MLIKNILKPLLLASSLSLLAIAPIAQATIVQFETALGNFEVNLYDDATPATVANFLSYVNAGAYNKNVVHRAESNFVVQAGGFSIDESFPLGTVVANPSVINEPVYSNLRGTIAMAKLSGQPDSATSQWFFNLKDNTNLDYDASNQGYAVFGEVVGDGMAIIDQIAALPKFNLGGALGSIPLQNFDAASEEMPAESNLIVISKITIIDPEIDTAASLSPTLNTSIPAPQEPQDPADNSGGGGSFCLVLMALCALRVRKRHLCS